ncbi:MAG: MCE family protein [Rhodobacteraceae bacterium]|nr:MCE family protein [Paracoccaceae bacterium]
MTDPSPPTTPILPARKSLLERVSIVWVIPAAALAIALGVAWHSYSSRGPLLELSFENASGIRAGETELRYRDVTVGLVEGVSFSDGLDRVLVSVRLDKKVAPYVDGDATFWVVRPQVSARGVTGLDTVLSGIFIQGIWNDKPDGFIARHKGEEAAPLNRDGRQGLRVRLRAAPNAGLTEEAPIVFRGIEVGRIGTAELAGDGTSVEADAIIFAPHDKMISSATRFWDISGFSFSIGPTGAKVDFSSLAALVSGGITFQTVVSGGQAVEPGALFVLYPDEGAARASLFGDTNAEALNLTAIFQDNVAGLAVDSAVDLGGLRIGRVSALNGIVDEARFGDRRVRLAATLAIQPSKLGLDPDAGAPEALDYLDRRVQEGLRARLATASLLTGGLKVELVDTPNATGTGINRSAEPNPVLPTTESDIADVSASAEGVFARINALPVEEVLESAIAMMDNISRLTGSDDIRAVPGDVRALLGQAQGLVGSDEMQALPGRISSAVGEIETLVARLETEDTIARLSGALDTATAAAQSVDAAVAGVPDLVARLQGVAAQAEALPLDDLASRLSNLLDSADRLIDTDAARALPADLSGALDELRQVLRQAREAGLIDNANATMASARSAADDLPALLQRAQTVLTEAARTISGYDANQGVGRDLEATLREVRRAAEAVAALARAVERNPNSLLFGR